MNNICRFRIILIEYQMSAVVKTTEYREQQNQALFSYEDEKRDIQSNVAGAQGRSRGHSPRKLPRIQAILFHISQVETSYRHLPFLIMVY